MLRQSFRVVCVAVDIRFLVARERIALSRGSGKPEETDIAVGAHIHLRRNQLGISQSKLAEAIGVTFQQVQKYERGANRVSASSLVKIAKALNAPVAAFFGHENEGAGEQMFSVLNTPGASEMLEAYSRIRSAEQRQALVGVARTMSK